MRLYLFLLILFLANAIPAPAAAAASFPTNGAPGYVTACHDLAPSKKGVSKKTKKRRGLRKMLKEGFGERGGIGILALVFLLLILLSAPFSPPGWIILFLALAALFFSIAGISKGGKNKITSTIALVIMLGIGALLGLLVLMLSSIDD